MIFAGITFLYFFLPFVLIAYLLCPKQFRNGLLFLASLFFYAWGEPVYVLLMLFSTVSDYWHGRMVERFRLSGNKKIARIFLVSSILINLGLLGFFKYADWLISLWNRLTGMQIAGLSLALPLGISFYTFQTMSYTIDVYRGNAKAQKNILDFGVFVTMFPQLIAGPIVRYTDIAAQMKVREISVERLNKGMLRFSIGLAKKVLLANEIGALWERILAVAPEKMPVSMGWLGIVAFGLQIYYDFSGYSDMAIGIGCMLGFDFPENFDHPYESVNISEFFRRWHMTLQKWFAEYVYYPLGGNRKGIKRQILNLTIVWALTGIWHGASGNFLVWGLYFAVFLILEKLFLLKMFTCLPSKLGRFLGHVYTLVFVGIGWVFFTHTQLKEAFVYIGRLFGIGKTMYGLEGAEYSLAGMTAVAADGLAQTGYLLSQYGGLLLIGLIGATDLPAKLAKKMLNFGEKNRIFPINLINAIFIAICLLICTAYLVDASYNPFLYFRF